MGGELMSGLMLRRQAMMAGKAEPAETWDTVWSYTQGTPDANGWTKYVNGTTASGTIVSNGLQIVGAGGTGGTYIYYQPPVSTYTTGVTECKVLFTAIDGGDANNYRYTLSNGANGIQVYVYNDGSSDPYKLKLYNQNAASAGTTLASIALNTWYTIRLELGATTSAVYLDDTLLLDNIPNNTMKYCTATRFWQMRGGTSIVEYVKIKQ